MSDGFGRRAAVHVRSSLTLTILCSTGGERSWCSSVVICADKLPSRRPILSLLVSRRPSIIISSTCFSIRADPELSRLPPSSSPDAARLPAREQLAGSRPHITCTDTNSVDYYIQLTKLETWEKQVSSLRGACCFLMPSPLTSALDRPVFAAGQGGSGGRSY